MFLVQASNHDCSNSVVCLLILEFCNDIDNDSHNWCQGCVITLHQAILTFSNNTESTREFLINHIVFFRAVKCPNCGSDCSYRPDPIPIVLQYIIENSKNQKTEI